MKLDKKSTMLYAITDRAWLGDKKLSEVVEDAILGGATFIQIREKSLGYEEFLNLAMEVKMITDKYNIPFVINDNVKVAYEIDADGVHIGQSDEEIKIAREILGNDKIIGVSARTVEEAIKAEQDRADYIGVGAIFSTSTKHDADNVTKETLKEICQKVNIPVVAIGGITKENVLELVGTGISGISVVSAIFSEKDIKNAASELLELTKQIVK